jgi:hypothetical protein
MPATHGTGNCAEESNLAEVREHGGAAREAGSVREVPETKVETTEGGDAMSAGRCTATGNGRLTRTSFSTHAAARRRSQRSIQTRLMRRRKGPGRRGCGSGQGVVGGGRLRDGRWRR